MAGEKGQDQASSDHVSTSMSNPRPPENANLLPGGNLNTAGGKIKEAGLIDAAKTVHISELQEVHKQPCVRDAFMTGIGAGFGIGGVRAILGGQPSTNASYAGLFADHVSFCS